MTDFTCPSCDEDFEAAFPFGDDIKCPRCSTWLATDTEYDYDNMYAWITGVSSDQEQEL